MQSPMFIPVGDAELVNISTIILIELVPKEAYEKYIPLSTDGVSVPYIVLALYPVKEESILVADEYALELLTRLHYPRLPKEILELMNPVISNDDI